MTLRRLTRLVGMVLLGAGVFVAGFAVFAGLARALPLGMVLANPGFVAGLLAAAAGIGVLGVVRGTGAART